MIVKMVRMHEFKTMMLRSNFIVGDSTYHIVVCSKQVECDVRNAIIKRISESNPAEHDPEHDSVFAKVCDVTLRMGKFLDDNREILDIQISQYNGKIVFMMQCMGIPAEDRHSKIRGEKIQILSESKEIIHQLIDTDAAVRRKLIETA